MNSESSSQETATTTTLTREPTQKESIKQDVPSVATEDISETNTTLSGDKSSEPTPNELVNLGRPPYVVDLLRARPAYETFDMKEQLHEIDEFIRDGLEDSRVAYENALRGIKAYIKETDDVYNVVEQIRDYIRIQQKIKNVIREREEFEAKDPAEMTANQLKRYFKSHARNN